MSRTRQPAEQAPKGRTAQRSTNPSPRSPAADHRAAGSVAPESPRLARQGQQIAQLQGSAPASPAGPAGHAAGLPEGLRGGIESLSGMDMSGVRVHRNSSKPAALQAHAYAQGQDIHLGPGQERHLPHEAWHVVQQAQGRVRPTMQMKAGAAINADPSLEGEADRMGAKAAALGSSPARPAAAPRFDPAAAGPSAPLQLKGNLMLSVETLQSKASSSLLFSDSYDRVVNEVAAYYDGGQTPDQNFGMQLRRLGMIRAAIQSWAQEHGPLNQAVVKGFFGLSKVDTRRQALRDLENTIAPEETHVQQQGKQAADLQHQQDRAALKNHIEAGKGSANERLRNTCEWVLSTNKTRVYAVTSTGDAYERLHQAGMSPTADGAFFPTGLAGSPGDFKSGAVSYVATNLADHTNVMLKSGGARTGGWQTDGHVAITNVRKKSRTEVLEVLTHEVQHDSDKHYGRDSRQPYRSAGEAFDATGSVFGPQGPTHPNLRFTPSGELDWASYGLVTLPNGKIDPAKSSSQDIHRVGQMVKGYSQGVATAKTKLLASAAEQKLERYKTEYRAYAYQEYSGTGTFSMLDNTVQNQVHGGEHFSARQLAIFKHIYGDYQHTKDGWDQNPVLADGVTRFRPAVSGYWNPDTEGFNKVNSVRIDDVYNALDAVGVKAARTQIEVLHGVDAAPVGAGNKVSDAADPGVLNLLAQIEKLHVAEADYILNQSQVWPAKIARHLDGAARAAVDRAIEHPINQDRRLREDAHKARYTNFWGP